MRIIIAGGRDFNDYEFLKKKVISIANSNMSERCYSNYEIISGGARGADTLGERFADEYKRDLKIIEADWENLGKMAGPIRNIEMARYAKRDGNRSILIAFWDGKSRGTKNMIDEAYKNKLDEVHVYKY